MSGEAVIELVSFVGEAFAVAMCGIVTIEVGSWAGKRWLGFRPPVYLGLVERLADVHRRRRR